MRATNARTSPRLTACSPLTVERVNGAGVAEDRSPVPLALRQVPWRPRKRLCKLSGMPPRYGMPPWSYATFAISSRSPRREA